MRLNEAIDSFIAFILDERGLSLNTIYAYKMDLTKFLEFRGDVDVSRLNLEDIDAFAEFLSSQKLSQNTKSRIFSSLRSFFSYIEIEEISKKSIASDIQVPRKVIKLPNFLTEEEVNKLLETPNLDTPKGIRDRAILEFMYATGVRVSELTNLKLQDLLFDEKIARIRGKGGKERIVPFNDYAEKFLLLYIYEARSKILKKRGEDKVFLNLRGNPISRVSIWKILKEYTLKAGISKNIYPHILRHTFATHMLKNGCDLRTLQLFLGHSSMITTQIYTHLDRKYLREVHKKFHPRG
ncbi:MAG TPA: site-specific tyrosine recombinase XerD [Candidatus Hydrothermia bacterium]|mgnify:CR=1 FL=1|nr:site-specific tyrosine recombinase XerD [Candidatus Hydrothermia bacterium]